MPQGTLVIGDHHISYHDGRGARVVVQGPDDIPVGTSLRVLLNFSDLDVYAESIPAMGRWDRYGLSRMRSRQESTAVLKGHRMFKDSLVEVSCPLTDDLRHLLEALVNRGIRITRMEPLLITPLKPHPHTLVVSDHGADGIRHTLFQESKPLFTRLTSAPVEVMTTMTYLRNHFQLNATYVQCHITPQDFELLVKREDMELGLYPLVDLSDNKAYAFSLPAFVREANNRYRSKIANGLGAVAAVVLFMVAGWQYYDYQGLQDRLEGQQQKVSGLSEKLTLLRADLPLDKLLPQSYKDKMAEPSPIDLLRHISSIMSNDMTLSALKWENTPQEERLLLQVRIVAQDEDLDQNVDVVQDFKTNLASALPGFVVEAPSLPHGSGDQETFTGSTNAQDLTLAGDREKATVQLTRKKS